MRVCRKHPTSVDEISGSTMPINDTSTHSEAASKIAQGGLKLKNVATCMITFVNIMRNVACCFLELEIGNDIVAVYPMSA